MSDVVTPRSGSRSVARKLALQALYRWQLNACPWQDLVSEFAGAEDMARADGEYFRELVAAVTAASVELDAALQPLLDRPPARDGRPHRAGRGRSLVVETPAGR